MFSNHRKLTVTAMTLLMLVTVVASNAQTSSGRKGWFVVTVKKTIVSDVQNYIESDPAFAEGGCVRMTARPGFKPKEHKFGPWKGYQQIGYECANVSSDTFELFGEAALEYSTDPGRKVLLRFFSIGTDPDGGGSCSSNICSGTPKMVNPPYSCTPCS
jgi:hypothetical protein